MRLLRPVDPVRENILFDSIMNPQEDRASQLFLQHHDFVKGRVLRYAPLPDFVEDITHQVFIEFVSKSEQWNLEKDVRPILVTLVKGFVHRAFHENRRNHPGTLMHLAEMIAKRTEANGNDEFDYAKEKTALRKCMGRLKSRNRELVTMYYYEERSLGEIGELMLVSSNAASHALCRIREMLRKCIKRTLLDQ